MYLLFFVPNGFCFKLGAITMQALQDYLLPSDFVVFKNFKARICGLFLYRPIYSSRLYSVLRLDS